MAIPKIIHAIARPKINLHFPNFSINVAHGSKVPALQPVHASLNEVRRTTVLKSTHPGCVGLFPINHLIS